MDAPASNIYEQVYNVSEDETLMSRVALVVCVLVERGLFAAGFSINRELLTIHYTGYNKNKPVWDLDFFEHLMMQEPLLNVREKVKGVLVCSNKNLVVPDALYDEKEAKAWLRHLHFIEAKDNIDIYPLEDDKSVYLHAVPLHISELIKINFRKATLLPLCIYHFKNIRQQSLHLQFCITSDQVCVTLHNYSQLLWHRVFSYTTPEDIVYEIKHFCMENNISPSKIAFRCDALSAAEYEVIKALTHYLTGIRSGKGAINGNWDASISLAQQLLTCVS